MTGSERAELAFDVYCAVVDQAESLEEADLGADLAYLMGAILRDAVTDREGYCEWSRDRPIVRLLEQEYPLHHDVWRYVRLED